MLKKTTGAQAKELVLLFYEKTGLKYTNKNIMYDGKEDPSDGWSSWMNTIISLCRLIATTLIKLPSSMWILEAWCLNM